MTVIKTAGYFVVSTFLVLSSLLKASKSSAKTQTSRFSRVISFGDSLSDVNNYAQFNGVVNQKGNLPGRASNGTLWVENLYPHLPRENYAYLGARSSKSVNKLPIDTGFRGFEVKGVMGLGHQLNIFRYNPNFKNENYIDADHNREIKARFLEKINRYEELAGRESALNGLIRRNPDLVALNAQLNALSFRGLTNGTPEYAEMRRLRAEKEQEIKDFKNTLPEQMELSALNVEKSALLPEAAALQTEALKNHVERLPQNHQPRSLDPKALYTVWIGMNDLRHLDSLKKKGREVTEDFALQTARDAVANVNESVKYLVAGGAKYIVVANLPTIFLTGDDKEASERLIKFHNNQLHQDLVAISSLHKDVNIIPIDMQTLGDELKANPGSFGFTNVSEPCAKGYGRSRQICSSPDSYVFWDAEGHLTRKGNELLAKYVEELLRAPYDIVPQVAATESIAVSATKNVNQRLFALRGANHALSDSASSLLASHFQNTRSHGESSMASVMMTSDGNGISLPEFKKNHFVRRAQAPLEGAPKKNYFPSLNSDAQSGKFGIFLSGDLHIGNQRNTEETTGYRHNTKTVTFGADYKFADWFLSGIAMSYIKSDTKLKDNRGDVDIDGYAVSFYDSFKWRKFYLDSVFTYGWNQNKIRRNIHTFDRQAIGNPLGRHWSIGGIGGYDFHWAGFHFGPTAGIRYGEARIHRYKEDGAGAFNMIVSKQSSSSAVSTFGGHISHKFKTPIGDITPQLRSSYDHEFKDRSRVVITELATMRGIPYRVPVKNNDHNYGRIGGGINMRFKNDLSLSFDYETIFARHKARDHFIFGKIRFVF
jgi:phospholipase/lecithinase/hemolysin/uncharacterized protein YhjY with autotransporter beta-barrel domain